MAKRAKATGTTFSSLALLGITAAAGMGFAGCAEDGEEDVCVSLQQYFAEEVWAPVINKKCVACHNQNGIAQHTKMVFSSPAEAGYLENNLEIAKNIASLTQNGESLLVLKPTGATAHEGGTLVTKGSDEETRLRTLVDKVNNPPDCETNDAAYFAGLEMAGPEFLVRKAALNLAARLPTQEELDLVNKEGFDALDQILDVYMDSEAFYDRIREAYNDLFWTDMYLNGDALDLLVGDEDEENYYNPEWFEGIDDPDSIKFYGASDAEHLNDILRSRTTRAVAREPVELIVHIVRNNRPFSEVLTADYIVVNPYSAKAYGVTDVTFENEADPFEFREARLPNISHAGVLSSPMWLNRHPTTPTNRNRHRSRMVYYDWLGTDILKTAERPIDPTKITDFNPTMNNPACTVCHVNIDPVAGAFMNYQGEDEEGFTWYQDMRPPGFGKEQMPFDQFPNALQWLAKRVTTDKRFAVSATFHMFRSITGQEPMLAPEDTEDPEFSAKFKAYLGQYYTLTDIANEFEKSNYNLKVLVKGIIKSPYFRAINAAPSLSEAQLVKFQALGMGHFLTPEQLNRKLTNVLGVYWGRDNGFGRKYLLSSNEYRLLYGGTDSQDVTKRITEPNGVMANIADRMANELSCVVVPGEFALPPEERRLFANIETSFEPKDANGFEVEPAVRAIKEVIVELHWTLLGERLSVTDPEVERTYQLFAQTWEEGKQKIALEEVEGNLGPCGVDRNYQTGEEFPEEEGFYDDDLYTVRAWMAVTTYMLADYAFIYE